MTTSTTKQMETTAIGESAEPKATKKASVGARRAHVAAAKGKSGCPAPSMITGTAAIRTVSHRHGSCAQIAMPSSSIPRFQSIGAERFRGVPGRRASATKPADSGRAHGGG
jgi:hypothetical protein